MVTLFRWLLRLTVGLIVAALVAGGLATWFAMRSLPEYDATHEVAGIAAPVEIVRTTDAVPHIFAQTDADAFFAEVEAEGVAFAEDARVRTTALGGIPTDLMFDHVYSEQHPLIDAQRAWLAEYEASFEEGAS